MNNQPHASHPPRRAQRSVPNVQFSALSNASYPTCEPVDHPPNHPFDGGDHKAARPAQTGQKPGHSIPTGWDQTIAHITQAAAVLVEETTRLPQQPLTPQQRKVLSRAVSQASGPLGTLQRLISATKAN